MMIDEAGAAPAHDAAEQGELSPLTLCRSSRSSEVLLLGSRTPSLPVVSWIISSFADVVGQSFYSFGQKFTGSEW